MTLNLRRMNTRLIYSIDGSIVRERDSARDAVTGAKIPPQRLSDAQRRALHDLGELIQTLHIFANVGRSEQDEMVAESAEEIIDEKEMFSLCKSFQTALNGRRGARVIQLPQSGVKNKRRYQNSFPKDVSIDCICGGIRTREELEGRTKMTEPTEHTTLLLYASPAVEFNGRKLGQNSRGGYEEAIFQSRRRERLESLRRSPLGLSMLKERVEATLKNVASYAIRKTNLGYTVLKDFVGETQWKTRKNIVVDEEFLQGYIDAMIAGGVSVRYRRPIFTALEEHDKLVAKIEQMENAIAVQ